MGERESACVKFFENVIEPKIKPSPLTQAGFDNANVYVEQPEDDVPF